MVFHSYFTSAWHLHQRCLLSSRQRDACAHHIGQMDRGMPKSRTVQIYNFLPSPFMTLQNLGCGEPTSKRSRLICPLTICACRDEWVGGWLTNGDGWGISAWAVQHFLPSIGILALADRPVHGRSSSPQERKIWRMKVHFCFMSSSRVVFG